MGRDDPETRTDEDAIAVEEPPATTFADVDGLETELARLREAVVTPANDSRLDGLGASGVLIHGPAGVGKSHLARALVGEVGQPYVDVDPVDLPLESSDRAVERLAATRERAIERAPSTVLVEDLGVFAPGDDVYAATADVSAQVFAELRRTLDAFDRSGAAVLFVATTDSLEGVDERVRRPGRIDVRVGLSNPDRNRRRAVLETELRGVRDQAVPVEVGGDALEDAAAATEGLSVAALVEVVERATRRAVEEGGAVDGPLLLEVVDQFGDDGDEGLGSLFGSSDDSSGGDGDDGESDSSESDGGSTTGDGEGGRGEDGAASFDREGGRGDVAPETRVPDVGFEDVGGLSHAKRRLRETVEWPQRYPDRFAALDIETSRGIILHGPPGTGKTLLAKAIASETESTFLSVSGPELLDMYVGESERFVRRLFEAAREHAPSVVFIDEFDAVAGRRGSYAGGSGVLDSVVNQLLSELDGLTDMADVVVVAATNRLAVVDPAVRRPGRFGEEIEVPPPGPEARREIFRVHLAERTVGEDVDLGWLVAETSGGYTGADVAELCERAAMNALRADVTGTRDQTSGSATEEGDASDGGADADSVVVERAHFERALAAVEPTCGGGDRDADPRAFW